MHEEQGSEEIQHPGPDGGEGVRETTVEEPSQGKVEVAGEGQSNLPVHLTQRPLHAVPCVLHHLAQTLRGVQAGEFKRGGTDKKQRRTLTSVRKELTEVKTLMQASMSSRPTE